MAAAGGRGDPPTEGPAEGPDAAPADPLAEAEETVRLLVEQELEVHHRLEGHDQPLSDCPVCRTRQPPSGPA